MIGCQNLFPPEQPVFRTLEHPRAPSAAELQLLSRLIGGAGQELIDQVVAGMVIGECRCGCSSVELTSTAQPLPESTVTRLSPSGRLDYLSLSSTGLDPAGHRIDLVLHVVDGVLHELEVFDTEGGEGIPVDLSTLILLDPPDVD